MFTQGVKQTIRQHGLGSEAKIKIELRTEFPGIGGTIITNQGVATALREELNPWPRSGHKMFLRHMIIKKLDDFFFRTGVYLFAHVARPLGSISILDKKYEASLYEWAFGIDNFSWEYVDKDGNVVPTILHDWSNFVNNFDQAGIDLGMDCTDSDDGRISQNIIHQYPPGTNQRELCSLWKRIDFGFRSIKIDFEKLTEFLHLREKELRTVLRSDRYDMLLLAVEYLTKEDEMREVNIGRMDALIGTYRYSTLQHYASVGPSMIGTPVIMDKRTESLI
ncbi:MAG: hypothetical protein ACFFCQ_09710 [Promethearchaeota archaeon]